MAGTVPKDSLAQQALNRLSVHVDGLSGEGETLNRELLAFLDLFFRDPQVRLLVHPRSGTILEVNPSAATYFSLSPNRLRKKRVTDLFASDNPTAHRLREIQGTGAGSFTASHQLNGGVRRDVDIFGLVVDLTPEPLLNLTMHDITDLRQGHRVRSQLMELTEAISATSELEDLIGIIQQRLATLFDTTNFYVALYARDSGTYYFPYFTNEQEKQPPISLQKDTVTDYVRRTGKALLLNRERFDALKKQGEIKLVGKPCAVWMGAPLKTNQGAIGVVAVQHYKDEQAYNESDLEVLEFVVRAVASTFERRRAEQEWQRSEERFKTFVEQSAEGIWCAQLEQPVPTDLPPEEQVRQIGEYARIVECNQTFVEMYGFEDREEVLGKRIWELSSTYDSSRSTASLHNFVKFGYKMSDGESWERTRDGLEHVFLNQLIGIVQEGVLVQLWGAQRDITSRKQAETELEIRKTHLERFIQNSPEGILFVDQDDVVQTVNHEFVRMFGYAPDELLGQKNTLIVPKRLLDESDRLVEMVANSESVSMESVRVTREGSEIEVNILGTPIRIEGEYAGAYWVYRDITQQKRSAKLQSVLFHIAEAATASSDLDDLLRIIHGELGKLIDTTNFYVALYSSNRSTYRFAYFVDEQESIDTSLEFDLPNSLTDSVRKGGAARYSSSDEIRKASRSKGIRAVGPMTKSWLGVPLRAPEGTIGVVVVQSYKEDHAYTVQDRDLLEFVSGHIAVAIEHRRWQDAVTASEERYRTLFRQTPMGVILFDRTLDIIDCNDQILAMYGLKASEIIGLNLRDMNDRRLLSLARSALRGKTEKIDGIVRKFRSTDTRWMIGSFSPIYGPDQKISGGMILLEDVTEQRETARELELQRAYAHHLFEFAPEAIVLIDPKLTILRANAEFHKLFGFEENQLSGTRIDSLQMKPEGQRSEIDLKQKIRERGYFNIEAVRLTTSGEKIEVSILGGPILIDDVTVAYYLIYRDISERKRNERLQRVLYEIARAAATGEEAEVLLQRVQTELGQLIDSSNLSIAMYDSELDAYSFLYHADEYDKYAAHNHYPLQGTLTDYVRRSGKPQLVDRKLWDKLKKSGEVSAKGRPVACWIGVPLKLGETIFGVLSVVSYSDVTAFDRNDLDLLEFVSGQIAGMIEYKRAESALQASQTRYRALFEQASVSVFIFNRDLKLLDFNDRFIELAHSTRDRLTGLDLHELADKRLEGLYQDAINGKSGYYSGSYRSILTNREMYISIHTSPLVGSDGQIEGGIAILSDETEQKKTEQRAEINRVYLEQLFERSPEAIILLDPRLRAIRVNEEFSRLFGFTSQDVLGKPIEQLLLPSDAQFAPTEHIQALRRITKGELVRVDETICQRKDGSSVVTSLLGSPIILEGKVIALYGIYRDITAQKEAVEELAQEKERLSVTLSSIGEGVITTDIEGRVVMMNDAAESITGWGLSVAREKEFATIFKIMDPETDQFLQDPVKKVLQSGSIEEWTRDTLLRTEDSREVLLVGSAAPIHNLQGKVIGVVVVFRDVTSQRKLEDEIAKIERLESIGVLAGGIAHDFNNILAAVLGNISIAVMLEDNPQLLRERLTEAEKAALRARDLTQQLLTFSRGGEPVRKATDLGELVREATGFALRGSNVLSEFQIEKELWSADVDEGQVGRVIHNLVINADQAMPNGGKLLVTLKNFMLLEDSSLPMNPGRYVLVEIADEGIGIPQEYLQKIFDPFFTTKQRGSGLGLATSFSIVQKHGGFMTVSSNLDKGTTFRIYFPASDLPPENVAQQPDGLLAGEGRILVMDDEKTVQDVASVMLSRLGFEVVTASDGAEAIELYQQARMEEKPFRAVIMDLTIPGGMGGEEAVRHLLKLDHDARAIVSSGYSNDPIMSNYDQFGFRGVVAKPYRLQDLSRVLAQVLHP